MFGRERDIGRRRRESVPLVAIAVALLLFSGFEWDVANDHPGGVSVLGVGAIGLVVALLDLRRR